MDEPPVSVYEAIRRALDLLHIGSAFGPAVQQHNISVIPVGEVHVGVGYAVKQGYGDLGNTVLTVQQASLFNSGNVNSSRSGEAQTETGEPGEPNRAVSGGAQGKVIPRGYIQISPDGAGYTAGYTEMIDIPRLGLAGIALAAWITFCIGRTVQRVARLQAAGRR